MPRKDSVGFARDLQDHIAALERDIEAKLGELDRSRAALRALHPSGLPPIPVRAPKGQRARSSSAGPGTSALVLDLLKRHEPGFVVTAEEAVKLVDNHGWETASTDPVNAMRAALARSTDRGWLVRVSEGHYMLAESMREEQEAAPA